MNNDQTQTHLPTLLWGLLLFFVSINGSSGQDESPSRRLPQPQAISAPDSNQESKPPLDETANISIAEYRERLDALEQPVQRLAEQVRATEAKLGKEHADSAKLRAELRALVEKTFAERQEIQRAELAEFTRRLQRMQQAIETREQIAEKIVDRRVEELLAPDASWDTATSEVSPLISRDDLVASLNLRAAGLKNWKCSNASVQLSLPGILPQRLNGTVACASPGQLRVTCDNFVASMDIGLNNDTGWLCTKPGDGIFTTSWNTSVEAPWIGESHGWIIPSPMWMMTLLGVQSLDPERYELQKPASGSNEAWLVAMEEGRDGRLLRHIIKVDSVSSVIRSHTLYDGDGKPLLVARLGEYKACGEFQLPHYLNVQFPTKNTFAEFKFADIETNADLPDALWQRRNGQNLKMFEIDTGSILEALVTPNIQQDPNSTSSNGRAVTTTTGGAEISYIPWKSPKNARKLEIAPTAWGESVSGLRVALAVTDGPEEKPGMQRLHLVINNVSNELIRLDNTGWADDFTMAMHVRRNSGEQVETRRPEQGRFFAPSTGAYSLEPGETVVLATKLIGLGLADESNSEDIADLWIVDQGSKINPDGRRTWYIVGSSIIVPGIPGHETEFRLHTESTDLEFGDRRAEQNSATDKNSSSSAPKLDVKESNGIIFESAAATDQTSPPESDAEKAIASMILVFFQDEARRAVPGLMIDHGTETLVLTTGPATIVPEGVGHAIDRAFLEFPGEADVASEYIDIKTADIRFHRAKPRLTQFQLNEPVDLAIGDSLSAIIQSGQPNLRVTPRAARISALDQATSFSLATHKFRHEFSGLVQIDTRLPEGTPLFKNGELAGITLLGTRFMKDDVPGSYVVSASRIVEVLQQLKTE